MYVQENLTTTPHEVPGVSWELPDSLTGKFWSLGAFAKLVLDENRTRITDIVEDTEKRKAAEAEAAREEAEDAEIKAKQKKLASAAALEEQGIKTMARVMFRNAAPQMAADDVIACRSLAEDWMPGIYSAGDVRCVDGVPYRCVQGHDSTVNPDWNPSKAPALWAAYHGTGRETALPVRTTFIRPGNAWSGQMVASYELCRIRALARTTIRPHGRTSHDYYA